MSYGMDGESKYWRDEHVKKLEKENAELKAKNINLIHHSAKDIERIKELEGALRDFCTYYVQNTNSTALLVRHLSAIDGLRIKEQGE